MKPRYLSVCSGIEAATAAWSPLGFRAIAFSEIEPFPSALLSHHYPDVPNLGDMTKVDQVRNAWRCGLRRSRSSSVGERTAVFTHGQ